MKLRDRLYLFSTAQLLVFGGLFALAYLAFERQVLPMFEDLLHNKTEQVTRLLASELDVPLGADDRPLLEQSVAGVAQDQDLAYLVVLDAHGRVALSRGMPAPADLLQGRDGHAGLHDGVFRAWASISLEGMKLGVLAIGFSTARVATLDAWARRIAIGATATWLLMLCYAIGFARLFVVPIRAMMVFSRKVAGGALSERLDVAATGELGELRDYLNQMTADLERREAERKAAAAHAEAMQRELLAVSRMAGMAEIATGVLHNVGNVLNSLNVSVTMIGEQVRGSRVGGLIRSIELVDQFPGGLAAFLTTDKGKLLPGYLSTVTLRLAEDNTRLLDEVAAVHRNVDHIKTIVAMQQSYARPSGLHEPVAIGPLIDDALRMGEASFAKHGIEVVRDYEPATRVVTDRHKLLQILINLISNARHALKDHRGERPGAAPAAPHRLIVQVRATPIAVTIAVSDTGIGIPTANLDKIFQHGFTTKPGGHGFGLHASANAARELGGNLVVASAGPGLGATFTLELPSAMPAVMAERAHDLHN